MTKLSPQRMWFGDQLPPGITLLKFGGPRDVAADMRLGCRRDEHPIHHTRQPHSPHVKGAAIAAPHYPRLTRHGDNAGRLSRSFGSWVSTSSHFYTAARVKRLFFGKAALVDVSTLDQ